MAFPNITTLRFRRSYYLSLYCDFVQHFDYALFLAANRPSDIFLMVCSYLMN